MKKSVSFFCILLMLSGDILGQSTGDSLLVLQSRRLSNLLKDSLSLSTEEAEQLFTISLTLSQQKKAAFQLQDRALIGKQLQVIENSRDSLYQQVLRPELFELYKRKKVQLLNKSPKG